VEPVVLNRVLLIAGMTAVTYLPRLLPLVLRGRARPGAVERRAIRLVPVTAVGALIIPGGLAAVQESTLLSGIGLLAAVGLALLVRQPFLVVVGSVAAVALAIVLGL
jgi:branched-subunit amino acid transport protein